jgi:predicted TIM-barrel fold metal-dependent hydrolase
MTPRIVDAWAQPPSRGFARPEMARLLGRVLSHRHLDRPDALTNGDPSSLVADLDAAGIEKALLTAWCAPFGWVVTNDEVAGYVKAYPDRFAGVAAVMLDNPIEAVRELERAVTQLGFVALRVVPWLWGRPPNDARYWPLYVRCVELGVPFCTQAGHSGPHMPSEPGRPVPYLDEVACTFPELTIVAGHIGYPWTEEMIGLAWKYDNVYIDTSAHLPHHYPPALLHFLATRGRDKVLFGTNGPQLSFRECANQARELELPAESLDALLSGNALRVFNLR